MKKMKKTSLGNKIDNLSNHNLIENERKPTENERKPLRIIFATEYLPPFVSGISNRCKNWINGYRKKGHSVKVFSVDDSE